MGTICLKAGSLPDVDHIDPKLNLTLSFACRIRPCQIWKCWVSMSTCKARAHENRDCFHIRRSESSQTFSLTKWNYISHPWKQPASLSALLPHPGTAPPIQRCGNPLLCSSRPVAILKSQTNFTEMSYRTNKPVRCSLTLKMPTQSLGLGWKAALRV